MKMNNLKKRMLIVNMVSLIIITLVSGCGMHKRNNNSVSDTETETEEELVLNERQIEILLKHNIIPDKMTSKQKEYIVLIEEMLVYVEAKYNTKICYTNFHPSGPFNSSYDVVCAYPEGGDPDWDFFEIRHENGVITDDYDCLLARPEYEERIEKLLDEVLVEDGCEYKYREEIGKVDTEGKATSAHLLIYIRGVEESEYEGKFEEIKEKFVENNMHVNLGCYFLHDEDYYNLTQSDLITGVTSGEAYFQLIEAEEE